LGVRGERRCRICEHNQSHAAYLRRITKQQKPGGCKTQ
jgi:hypothetical protein